jgi:hypothetical protein
LTARHKQWYQKIDGKIVKVIPANIGELLTPTALAYWVSSGGSFNKRDECIQISTDSFRPDEVDKFRSILLDQFNIETTRNIANKENEQYYIRIPKREVLKLQGLVRGHIPSMMAHRVGL